LEPGAHGVALRRGADPAKDQSYVLFPLTADQREACLFPVGGMDKAEVRRIAARAGLPTAEKGESQDICFVPAGDYAAFLEGRGLRPAAGEIRHVDGRLLGRHGGVHRFTVGQRRGIGVPAPEPLYVVRLDGLRGDVVVGPRRALEAPGLLVSGWVWHRPEGARPHEVLVQTRYRQEPAGAALLEARDGVVIRWAGRPLPAAPGQAAVAYRGDTVVGGGWIEGVLGAQSP
jgi:tRNA-specific 2-thiouridylase